MFVISVSKEPSQKKKKGKKISRIDYFLDIEFTV